MCLKILLMFKNIVCIETYCVIDFRLTKGVLHKKGQRLLSDRPFTQLKYLQLLSGTRFLLCIAARPYPVLYLHYSLASAYGTCLNYSFQNLISPFYIVIYTF